MSSGRAARLGWSALALSLGLEAGALVLVGVDPQYTALEKIGFGVAQLAIVVAFSAFGALIATREPHNAIGWLFVIAGLGGALNDLSHQYADRTVVLRLGGLPAPAFAAWVAEWSQVAVVPLAATVILLLFPDGKLPSPRWRPVLWFSIAGLLELVVTLAFIRGPLEAFPSVDNPLGILPPGLGILGVLWIASVLLCVGSLVVRYRRAGAEQRQQLRWMAAAAVVFLLSIAGTFVYDGVTGQTRGWPMLIGVVAVVVAAGVATLKYRLYGLDVVVNRTIVYGTLTGLVISGYVGLVAGLGALLNSSGIGVPLAATVLIAIATQPLRAVVQRRVNRLMYGDRDDPYRALARLGERLGSVLDPDAVLPSIVDEVSRGLRVPYCAIELDEGDGAMLAAEHGNPRGGELVRLPLEHRGETIGQLVVDTRSPTERLADADLRLLADFARQAGVAVHAIRLTRDLRRSRERLVAAREEERRRLRRDLHDGLGPSLAGIALEIEAALSLLERDAASARELLGAVKEETQQAIADIRRIAYDLRPPALDDLGLVAAIREQAGRLGSGRANGGVEVFVETVELPALPAAVEVAAYRIALEALTNVTRHSRASRCLVRLTLNGGLELEIADDGCGLSGARGLGLVSMRERAEELGGELFVGPPPEGAGTLVRATLPVAT